MLQVVVSKCDSGKSNLIHSFWWWDVPIFAHLSLSVVSSLDCSLSLLESCTCLSVKMIIIARAGHGGPRVIPTHAGPPSSCAGTGTTHGVCAWAYPLSPCACPPRPREREHGQRREREGARELGRGPRSHPVVPLSYRPGPSMVQLAVVCLLTALSLSLAWLFVLCQSGPPRIVSCHASSKKHNQLLEL